MQNIISEICLILFDRIYQKTVEPDMKYNYFQRVFRSNYSHRLGFTLPRTDCCNVCSNYTNVLKTMQANTNNTQQTEQNHLNHLTIAHSRKKEMGLLQSEKTTAVGIMYTSHILSN